ncbi:MAG: hypothetical protein J6J12_09870 [Oscillospiraceae bacterium]|nr:hypothetical protein [Oscillospiraceae bacterium]
MAEKKQQNPRRRRRQPRAKQLDLSQLVKKRFAKKELDFKPDPETSTWLKTRRMTQLQRLRLTKWALYIFICIACLVVQDVIMSQLPLFGACTDLTVCAILLITVLEGSEIGSIFVLISSILYYFSGSAPTAVCIGLLTYTGVLATMFRQMYWHRSRGSILLCAMLALAVYEIGLFITGLAQEVTIPTRIGYFGLTILYSCIAMIPLYSLIHKVGLIGGNTWKE